MLFFSKKKLLSADSELWHLENFEWLVKTFAGSGILPRTLLVRQEPGVFVTNGETGDALALRIFEKVKQLCGLEDLTVRLIPSDDPRPLETLHYNPGTVVRGRRPIGLFSMDFKRRTFIVSYDTALLQEPATLITTLAHELAHCLLATTTENPPSAEVESEFLTDLAAVYLGFGLFLANDRFRFRAYHDAFGQGWAVRGAGYLPESDLIFATALFMKVKGIGIDDAGQFLKPYLSRFLKRAFRDLQDHEERIQAIRSADPGLAMGTGADFAGGTGEERPRVPLTPKWELALWHSGRDCAARGKPKRALVYYSKAIEINPTFAPAFTYRGWAHADLAKWHCAAADLDRAIQLAPDDIDALRVRGWVNEMRGDRDAALRDYDQVLEREPDQLDVLAAYANVCRTKGEPQRALEALDRAILLDSRLSSLFSERGLVYGCMGEWSRALDDHEQAIDLDLTNGKAYRSRGVTYSRKGDYDRSIVDFDQAISLDPGDAEAFSGRGQVHAAEGNDDKALADLDEAIRLEPDFAAPYLTRADIYVRRKDHARAIADVDRVLGFMPNHPGALAARNDMLAGRS